jgi:hypothetical protein
MRSNKELAHFTLRSQGENALAPIDLGKAGHWEKPVTVRSALSDVTSPAKPLAFAMLHRNI